MRSNLTFAQRTALKKLSQSNYSKQFILTFILTINGFVILNNKDAIQKIEEQIGESVVSTTDPTSALTNKIQKHFVALRKQQKFEKRNYLQISPSNPSTTFSWSYESPKT